MPCQRDQRVCDEPSARGRAGQGVPEKWGWAGLPRGLFLCEALTSVATLNPQLGLLGAGQGGQTLCSAGGGGSTSLGKSQPSSLSDPDFQPHTFHVFLFFCFFFLAFDFGFFFFFSFFCFWVFCFVSEGIFLFGFFCGFFFFFHFVFSFVPPGFVLDVEAVFSP